jgi:hypothetical protein
MKKIIISLLALNIFSLYNNEEPGLFSLAHLFRPSFTNGSECDKLFNLFRFHYLASQQAWKKGNYEQSQASINNFVALLKAKGKQECTLSTGESLDDAIEKLSHKKK